MRLPRPQQEDPKFEGKTTNGMTMVTEFQQVPGLIHIYDSIRPWMLTSHIGHW